MTTLRQETLAVIETIPDEYMEKFLQMVKDFKKNFITTNAKDRRKKEVFARLDELFAKEKPLTEEQKRINRENTKKFIECADAIRKIIGDDIPWASEEEMIEELANDRRERMKHANYA